MNIPKAIISVIVPHLNQESQLRRCLESLVQQNDCGHQVEIIVVDNGSKRLPVEICKQWDCVSLELELTPGPGPARNKGVKLSSGEILAFIDADCIADPNWLKTIAHKFNEDGQCQIIGGDVRIAVENISKLTKLEAYEAIFHYRQKEYITKHGFSGTGNLAVRRQCYDRVGPFGGIHLAEDRNWGQRARRSGYSIDYVPDMIVFHPARKNFEELCSKWNRMIDHKFEEYSQMRFGRLRWITYTLAMAVSPIFEIPRIAASSRVSTLRDRCLAMTGLVQIRLFRARRMFELIFDSPSADSAKAWNRH